MIPYFHQPEIHLGPITFHAFGMLVALAILVGTRVLHRRSLTLGLSPDVASSLVTWVLVGGFLGAHLVDRLVYFPRQTLADPLSLLRVWEGISSFGGFLGAIAGAIFYLRRHPLGPKAWQYLDAICYAFPFGWIFGRMGCFTAHDHPGIRTDFFLGVRFPDGTRHDLGLEELLYTLVLAGVFLVLGRRPRPPSFFAGLLALLYAPVRFGLDFLRIVDVRYLGLTPGQYGAIALFLTGLIILLTIPGRSIDAQGDAAPSEPPP